MNVTSIKQRISQNARRENDSRLRLMADPKDGRFYRRRWLLEHGIPWAAGVEDYLKKRIAKELGFTE
jgi:hypothetical protein